MVGNKFPLDIDINITDNTLDTTVYRKPTYTGLLLNLAATVPMQWKAGLLNTLINRAYNVFITGKLAS